MAQRQVTDHDHDHAKRLLLSWLTEPDGDIGRLGFEAFELHIPNHTFPGEDFMDLAIDALDLAGVHRDDPIQYETLLVDHLPEIEFRGREHRRIRFAVMSTAARRAGLEPDLLDEITYWRTDDFWRYALHAAIALIRATADKTGQPAAELATRLAEHHNLELTQ